ncbi:hypothetical protein LguiB_033087 [Lonicera macranthoides]
MYSELHTSINPRKWRFTWESQSHIPTLRLLLFNPVTTPSTQCINLKLNLVIEQSLLAVSFFQDQVEVSLRVPIPRVLIDVESPVNFRALDNHIEVKLALLLPVDHPLVSSFDSVLHLEDDYDEQNGVELQPLLMDSDITKLSSMEGVHIYCRSCSTKLSRSLRLFEEMPSVNWREVADNWFGNCCCSFGGISEKMVSMYAKSYTCATGMCLLNTTSVVLCKDDIEGFRFPEYCQDYECEPDFADDSCLSKDMLDNGNKHGKAVCFDTISERMNDLDGKIESGAIEVSNGDRLSGMFQTLEVTKSETSNLGFCTDTKNNVEDHDIECCAHGVSEPSRKEQKPRNIELKANQKSFLNGFLGSVFMAKSSNISKDVHWIEFLCPQCSCLLGAYPSGNDGEPLDSGIHLFKCYISTCLRVGRSSDLFRKYNLERMFTNQLLESAKDELSFRTVVRDLHTKCPMLKIILLNTNSWSCTGYCFGTVEQVTKIDLHPTIKVLFSDCSKSTEIELGTIEEWVTKNQADEVYMLQSQIRELVETLESANKMLPSSHSILQGLSLSSLRK